MGELNNKIGLTVVPEPAQMALLFGAAVLAILLLRRRSHSVIAEEKDL